MAEEKKTVAKKTTTAKKTTSTAAKKTTKKVEAYDVLKYREKFIKKLKKEYQTKEEFGEKLFRDFQWQYWSRCEY